MLHVTATGQLPRNPNPTPVAKSRHRKAENLRRYFKPSPQAMRELTLASGYVWTSLCCR